MSISDIKMVETATIAKLRVFLSELESIVFNTAAEIACDLDTTRRKENLPVDTARALFDLLSGQTIRHMWRLTWNGEDPPVEVILTQIQRELRDYQHARYTNDEKDSASPFNEKRILTEKAE